METNTSIEFDNGLEQKDIGLLDSISIQTSTEEVPAENSRGHPLINTRALSQNAPTYELETFEKNLLIIFNQRKIIGKDERIGTEKDVQALRSTFKRFRFKVTVHRDFTKDKLMRKLRALTSSKNNLSEYGCIAVAVLTHGYSGHLRASDQAYSESELINCFKVISNQTLLTKPKVIIIQACRGENLLPGVPVYNTRRVRKDQDVSLQPYILPVESDMLILQSSYDGCPSIRDEDEGSWFVQELCSKINSLAPTEDLLSIMTVVQREVAIQKQYEEYNTQTRKMEIKKQMPVVTSTLIRKLFLKEFKGYSLTGDASPSHSEVLPTDQNKPTSQPYKQSNENASDKSKAVNTLSADPNSTNQFKTLPKSNPTTGEASPSHPEALLTNQNKPTSQPRKRKSNENASVKSNAVNTLSAEPNSTNQFKTPPKGNPPTGETRPSHVEALPTDQNKPTCQPHKQTNENASGKSNAVNTLSTDPNATNQFKTPPKGDCKIILSGSPDNMLLHDDENKRKTYLGESNTQNISQSTVSVKPRQLSFTAGRR